MLSIQRPDTDGFAATLTKLRNRGIADLERVEDDVRRILSAVRSDGDAAVMALTEQFENRRQEQLVLPQDAWASAESGVDPETFAALRWAAERVRRYHEHQRESGFRYEEDGVTLGQRVQPVEAAAVYAPGGKARYPSTVLMSAIPAAVAGVPRIVLVTPRPTPEILAAAALSGVTEIVDAGGAQAIAAVAYGTESVKPVDVVVGPGNIYVACAKRLLFGVVNIDQIAGPSEILVLADESASPAVAAADLLSQAEHDEDAYPLLVCLSEQFAQDVCTRIEEQLASLPRKEMTAVSLKRNGYAFVCRDLDSACSVTSQLAPEHLNLAVTDPEAVLPKITAAGAIFLGSHTPEAAGDYAAGPSHVLPTGGAARFGSPLGVYDFVVRTSLIGYSQAALNAQADQLERLAQLEGLEAHARAVRIRRTDIKS